MTLIETSSRNNMLSWILYGITSLLIIMVPLMLVITAIKNPSELKHFIVLTFLQLFVGVFSFRMILWFLYGKESVSIDQGDLIIKKSGTFWIKKEVRIPLKSIKKVSLVKSIVEDQSPSDRVLRFSRQMYIFKIQNTGRVEVIYSGFISYRFLDNLEFQEAHFVIDNIKKMQYNFS